jgi:hypothetical protein
MAEEGHMIDWELLDTKHDLASQDGAFAFMRDCQEWAKAEVEAGREVGIQSIIVGRKTIDDKPEGEPTVMCALSDRQLDHELEAVEIGATTDARKDLLAMTIKGIADGVNAVAIIMINEASLVSGSAAEDIADGKVPAPSQHPDREDIVFTTLEHRIIGNFIWVAKVTEVDGKNVVGEYKDMGSEGFAGRFCDLLTDRT